MALPYGRTIATCLPLLIAAAVACAILASWDQVIIGCALGTMAGGVAAHRGIGLLKKHLIKRDRVGFGPMRPSLGALLFFIVPALAGFGLATLHQILPGVAVTVLVIGSSGLAIWWLVMGCWVWRIERRIGYEVLLSVAGFHFARRNGHI